MYRLIQIPIYEQVTTKPAEQPEEKAEGTPTEKKKEPKQKLAIPTRKGVKDVVQQIVTNIAKGTPAPEKETVQKNESTMIKTFDQFVNEAKKEKWIGDIDMKKGALRKEMGKKKDEKISAKDIAKSEVKLAKKDKDKKKPGLQLDKKDAKTHKRNVLAKNLMKASGAVHESKAAKIKGVKSDLVKIHEVVEKMIKQTSAKK
jgi:hypothetical protein